MLSLEVRVDRRGTRIAVIQDGADQVKRQGRTASPAVAIVRFIIKPGSRQGSSSSPIMIREGMVIFRIASRKLQSERRCCSWKCEYRRKGREHCADE
jgi:hypothetical protein